MSLCTYCSRDLPANSSGDKCEKCGKNEEKYGKPTICKFCKLPAAFLDQKCVHCSYSERKHGQPKTCTTCGLKSAWPKDKNSKCICRLCAIRRGEKEGTSSAKKRHSSSHDTSGSAKKSKTEAKHKEKSHSEKHKSSYTSNALASILPLFGKNGNSNTPSTSGLPTFGQTSQEDVIQQLKDKNDDLQRQIMDLNKQLADKHSTNMELEMTLKRNEREYREKEQRNQKLFDTTVGNLQDQIKQLNKDLAKQRS